MEAPTKDFFDDDQEPLYEEWHRDKVWDGTKWVYYVRGAHKGWDFQDRGGGPNLYAVQAGEVVHVSFGAALGEKQFVIRQTDGSGWFYAHTFTRLPNFSKVRAGEYVAQMGNSGTVAKHLHLEHLDVWNDWYSSKYTTELHEEWETMGFTDDERRFLKNLVEEARTADQTAADVVRAAEKRHDKEHTHPGAGHTHTATTTVT